MALRGATKSIHNAKAIYLEVNEQELYKNCGRIHEIDAFLSAHHFNVWTYGMMPQGIKYHTYRTYVFVWSKTPYEDIKRVHTVMTPHGWGDALYILDEQVNA
jgi:hypothetical protein